MGVFLCKGEEKGVADAKFPAPFILITYLPLFSLLLIPSPLFYILYYYYVCTRLVLPYTKCAFQTMKKKLT